MTSEEVESISKFYITTAIPYVNARPHIGHALEFVQADVIVRSRHINGAGTFLTTGADENSLKNVQAAEKLGITTSELCATNAQAFKDLAGRIGLSYDSFVRSSVSEAHRRGTERLWNSCYKNGDIYKKNYRGYYCVGCEAFYTGSELVGGLCPEHKTKPEIVEEENYFFRLSRYQEQLADIIETDKISILPRTKKAEVLNFIKAGLEDFSISRSVKRARGWGIPVPGDSSQIVYVWFDALGIYLTGAGFESDEKKFEELWPADIHVIGKGIIRFHAIYWPAILLSAGLELPKSILVHGYVTVEGQKISKSLGNAVDPVPLIERHGADPIRYYLIKEISTFEDGNFSDAKFRDSVNNELVGNLGNFVNRTLTFIASKFGGKLDEQKLGDVETQLLGQVHGLVYDAGILLEQNELNRALLKIMEISNMGNRYFQNSEPWRLLQTDPDGAKRVLFVCANICRSLGILAYPFMPSASERLLGYLNEKPSPFKNASSLARSFNVSRPEILFKKLE